MALLIILVCPVGTWLQCRELQGLDVKADAVYILAGARHQGIRLDALRQYLEHSEKVAPLILVATNPMEGRWNRERQRNLKMHEWAVYEIEKMLRSMGADGCEILIVPGIFTGTDGEMEALEDYLSENPAVRSLVLISSSFHLRRVLLRFTHYAGDEVAISVLPAGSWEDRMPWTVLIELGKMGRDMLGLSRNHILSRE